MVSLRPRIVPAVVVIMRSSVTLLLRGVWLGVLTLVSAACVGSAGSPVEALVGWGPRGYRIFH